MYSGSILTHSLCTPTVWVIGLLGLTEQRQDYQYRNETIDAHMLVYAACGWFDRGGIVVVGFEV